MQHTMYVIVRVTKSGYLAMKLWEQRPPARYIGRLATHEYLIQVYTDELLTAQAKIAMLGRVGRWLMTEGEI